MLCLCVLYVFSVLWTVWILIVFLGMVSTTICSDIHYNVFIKSNRWLLYVLCVFYIHSMCHICSQFIFLIGSQWAQLPNDFCCRPCCETMLSFLYVGSDFVCLSTMFCPVMLKWCESAEVLSLFIDLMWLLMYSWILLYMACYSHQLRIIFPVFVDWKDSWNITLLLKLYYTNIIVSKNKLLFLKQLWYN